MNIFFRGHRRPLLAGLSVVLLTAACASTAPKSASQNQADRALAGTVENALNADPVH